jgi:hypothetical protein
MRLLKIETVMSPDGSTEVISGRHVKVLIWRKWAERYTEFQGFWSNYYPNKVISFLLRPSQSEYDETSYYSRIGYGLDPTRWVSTCYPATNYYLNASSKTFHPENVQLRYSTLGYRSDRNQTAGDYLQIDLGSSKSIVGVRVENRDAWKPFEYISNYIIKISTNGSDWTTKATKTNNRALNIVESWAPANARYIRIEIGANASKYWTVSGVFAYEATTQITGITQGTITEHLPPNVSLLTANVSAGATTAVVTDAWLFNEDDHIILGDDDGEEVIQILSLTDSTLTFYDPVVGNYTTANNAFALNYDSFPEIDLEYARRLDDIYKIAEYCTTNSVKWQIEVTDAGVVNFGLRTGSDKSGSVSFVKGTNIRDDAANTDWRNEISRIYVVGKGKGDTQDQTGSGWIGDGEYEHIEIDSSVTSKEAAISLAKSLLAKYSIGNNVHVVNVRDTYATGTWGIDDDITVTDPISGFSGSYRVVKVIRNFSSKGEMVSIECTGKITRTQDMLSTIIKNLQKNSSQSTRNRDDVLKLDTNYIFKVEAEATAIDPDTTIYYDNTTSNNHYIGMPSTASGDVLKSGAIYLKAGTYKVIWYSKVDNNTSSSSLVIVDVYAFEDSTTLTTLTLAPDDYSSTEFEGVQSSFNLTSNRYIIFRAHTFVTGITNWYCDFIGLQTSSDYILDYPVGPPVAPTGLTAFGGVNGITLKWTANTEADMEHYNIYVNLIGVNDFHDASTTFVAMIDSTAYYYFTTTYGTNLYFWITAIDRAANESDHSNVAIGQATKTSASNIEPGTIDADLLTIEERKWTSDINFEHLNGSTFRNDLWWGLAGSEKTANAKIYWSDGTTTEINYSGLEAGAVLMDGIYWFYWDDDHKDGDGHYDLQHTSEPGVIANYSQACGPGKGIVAVATLSAGDDPAGNPTIIPCNSYFPSIGVGVLNAWTIFSEHISATDWIEGKLIRTTGAGTGGVSGITLQDSGMNVYGSRTSGYGWIKFVCAQNHDVAYLSTTPGTPDLFEIQGALGANIGLGVWTSSGSAYYSLFLQGSDRNLYSDLNIIPSAIEGSGVLDIGNITQKWSTVYANHVQLTRFTVGNRPSATEFVGGVYVNEGKFCYTHSAGGKGTLWFCMLNDADSPEWVQVAIST